MAPDRSTRRASARLLPERYARYYLEGAPSLVWLVFANAAAVVVGLRFYVDRGIAGVSTFLWPLFADSPTAVFLATLSIATLLPNLGRSLDDAPRNRPLAYLHTLAFVWLVKYGLWTVFALTLGFSAYFPDLWGYFGIVLTHLAFVAEALLIPQYGRTTRGALALALGVAFLNDALDYGAVLLGVGRAYHPPLRYEPTLALVAGSIALSVLAVALADRAFDRL
jgi:uncharacterized membrane protein YpjA